MNQQLIEETSKENIIVHKLWSNFNKYEISTKKGGMAVVTNFFMKVFLMIQLSQINLKDLPDYETA